ncbi:MAG: CDP-glycerol glycerophosphotransferase family protein [Sphaerochaeta sp.]|jgi:hypothetical protein|nr:CDP-glycerol glycerophosphotransferase family protein [Sphaerochaeta sp.]
MIVWYIDPGTGSMLFSVVVGIAATAYFSFRALFVKLKMTFSSKEARAEMNRPAVPYVIYCEGRQYFNEFSQVVEKFESRGLPLAYYTGSEDDPVLKKSWNHVHAEYIGVGNKAYAKLNFLRADVVLMTTPSLDVYQLKRSKDVKKYVHILHAPSDATGYRLFGLDFFDAVLLTGEYQKKDIQYLEQKRHLSPKDLVVVGCTYLDVLSKKRDAMEKKSHPFTVLVSPSWGPSALLSLYGISLLDPLSKSGWDVIVRPHPQSRLVEKELLDKLQKRYAENTHLRWDFGSDNSEALAGADVMISDFSGIIFDYTFLYDKPVMYVAQDFDKRPYDAGDVKDEMWQFEAVRRFGIEVKPSDFPHIKDVIQHASDRVELRNARHAAKQEAWMYPGEAANRVVDYLVSVESQLIGGEAK